MQVPHRGLRIMRLLPPLIAPGSMFTAAILWNGTPASGLHGWATSGMGLYLSDPAVLGQATRRRYLGDCRFDGQPVTDAKPS
jgi:hypothetical protein